MATAFPNRWSGLCHECAVRVPAQAGTVRRIRGDWKVFCTAHSAGAPVPAPAPAPRYEPAPPTAEPAWEDDGAGAPATEPAPVPCSAGLDSATVAMMIRDAIDALDAATPRAVEIKIGSAPAVKIDGHVHPIMPRVLTALAAGLNVYMVGPAGCGKTTIAEQAATALGVPFWFTGAVGSPYELLGYRDANGNLQRTQFREAYEHGGLFLFDEIDASDVRALLRFNAALANGWADFPDGKVKRHAAFKCIAAANTFGRGADRQYVGRAQLDAATLDRFAFLTVDYDERLEQVLGAGSPQWVRHVQATRAAVYKLKLRHVVSTRAVMQGAALLAAGVKWSDVEDTVLWKGADDDTVGKIKSAVQS